ncbi:mitochondrial i-AAA+ ATPase [Andalucia godoyi]|uniref:Mitochondrial i-AAA+ ATPase n=1 Tax=Andalucia godoyi TaxID=505711 RepID=A0A8K0AH36_ANDGO|nr:mitochondrial i-AAA+ ATPase [Andalucia godoyi]|eukprot:ANDGO_04977.mRNA.1 mitochondrial i-AAA+ ATPase (Yme1 homolog)
MFRLLRAHGIQSHVRIAKESLSMFSAPTKRVDSVLLVSRSFASFLGGQDARLKSSEALANMFPDNSAQQARYLKQLRSVDPESVVKRYESLKYASSADAYQEYLLACGALGMLNRAIPDYGSNTSVSKLTSSSHMNYPGNVATAQNPMMIGSNPAAFSYPPPPAPSFQQQQYPYSSSQQPVQQNQHPQMQMNMNPAAGYPTFTANFAGSGGNPPNVPEVDFSKPINVVLAEPSTSSQFWRTIKMAVTGIILVSAMGVFVEDRAGLSRNMSFNPEANAHKPVDVRFEDVKGCDECKSEVIEVVDFLRDPAKFTRLGGKLPKGLLLVGPPGTGKTLLAKAIAGEAGVPFLYVSGSEFEEMFVGVGAKRVRELFAAAKKFAPCIVFIDEIDAVGATRNPRDQQHLRMTLNQLLAEMDGFNSQEGIIVIGATNFAQALDKALIRPGRFDRTVVVPAPDVKGREEILKVHFEKNKVPRDATVNLQMLARNTPGFCGADLANLVNIAALRAALKNKQAVSVEEIEFARDRILMGIERSSFKQSPEAKRLTAYHEGGHALVALLTEGASPIHKATIVPRGQALGMVQQVPKEGEGEGYTRKQMRAMVDVCMGGRVAEELIFGRDEITTGASSDIEQATRIAREMITRYGMSDLLGPVDYAQKEGSVISEETRKQIEVEVREMVAQSYERVRRLLKSNEKDLHSVAKTLLDRETLTGVEIMNLVQKGPHYIASNTAKLGSVRDAPTAPPAAPAKPAQKAKSKLLEA